MNIGVLPNPQNHPLWPAIEYYLEPAAKRGGVPILEENELVWVVLEDGELLGAATARLTKDFGEVVLVGGKDHRRWIHKLDHAIGVAMKAAGKTKVRAYGRKGWVRVLKDWAVIGSERDAVGYEREL